MTLCLSPCLTAGSLVCLAVPLLFLLYMALEAAKLRQGTFSPRLTLEMMVRSTCKGPIPPMGGWVGFLARRGTDGNRASCLLGFPCRLRLLAAFVLRPGIDKERPGTGILLQSELVAGCDRGVSKPSQELLPKYVE